MPAEADRHDDTVHLLMAVYNGAGTLRAQLDSIAAQTHTNWHLLASDDGSRDDSMGVLKRFQTQHGRSRVSIIKGPGRGASANFMGMLRHLANRDSAPRWIAFSDQDDVWLPGKISRALSALRQGDPAIPTLYCSRTWVTSDDLTERRLSPPRPRPPDFRNALVQNIAAGNTIVLNPAGARLVLSAARRVGAVVVHDWWLYQLITGAGGAIIHDEAPGLLYRQHGANQIGINDTARARMRRLFQLWRGDFRAWNQTNINALRGTLCDLHPDHRAQLEGFARLSTLPLVPRLLLLRELRLYRQTAGGTFTLWLAVMFRLV